MCVEQLDRPPKLLIPRALPPQVNPYMDASVGGANSGLFSLSKQRAAAPSSISPGSRLAGVSSFAFQGTNAHLLLSDAPAGQPAAAGGPAWQHQYVQVLPPAHSQLRSVAADPAAKALVLEMRVGQQAVHAFFCDHQVSGKLIFPGKPSEFALGSRGLMQ